MNPAALLRTGLKLGLCALIAGLGSAAPSRADEDDEGCRPNVRAAAYDRASAPADEYFGHIRYSVLGIKNALRTLALEVERGDDGPDLRRHARHLYGAINDWACQYPADPWLPGVRREFADIVRLLRAGDWMPPSAGDR